MPTVLRSAELSNITKEISKIINDDTISTTITYRMTGTTVANFDPTTAIIPDMYAESSVSAFRGSYTLDEVEKSGGLLEAGDLKFILMTNSLSGALSVDDQVFESFSGSTIQSSTTYEIMSIKNDPLKIAMFLQCRSI